MQPNQPFQQFQPYTEQPVVQPPKKHKPWALIGALVVAILLFFGALGFGMWAYANMTDYKDNSDKKAAAAAEIAVQKEGTRKDTEFVEKEKNPLKKYIGPAAFGTVDISYPKTWSAYVIESDQGATPVDAYFHPNFVPNAASKTAFALRLRITGNSYDQEMKKFESYVKAGKVKVSAYTPKNVPGKTGSYLEGEIETDKQGAMVVLPLRDKTIMISSESKQFLNDFNNIVLANLKFVP